MNWFKLVFQLLRALPQIIALVKEIDSIINQIKNPVEKTLAVKHKFWLLDKISEHGLTPITLSSLHSFRIDLAQQVKGDA